IGELPYLLTLGTYAFYWFTLQPQRAAPAGAGSQTQPQREVAELPLLEVTGKWDAVFQGKGRGAFEQVLLAFLQERPWFAGKGRQAKAATILDHVPIPCAPAGAHIALVQV